MFTFVLMRIIAVILLVAANAFFAAGEYALVSIRDTRLQQLIDEGRIGARTIRKLHNKLDEVLNGIQIGVTMASLALGWIGEESMARVLEVPLARLPHSVFYAHALATVFAFTTITYLHVILGEVVPKSIALQKAEQVALAVAGPLDVFITIFGPGDPHHGGIFALGAALVRVEPHSRRRRAHSGRAEAQRNRLAPLRAHQRRRSRNCCTARWIWRPLPSARSWFRVPTFFLFPATCRWRRPSPR